MKYYSKRIHIKVGKSYFGKFNFQNDVIHDVNNIIWNINLHKSSRFWEKGNKDKISVLEISLHLLLWCPKNIFLLTIGSKKIDLSADFKVQKPLRTPLKQTLFFNLKFFLIFWSVVHFVITPNQFGPFLKSQGSH